MVIEAVLVESIRAGSHIQVTIAEEDKNVGGLMKETDHAEGDQEMDEICVTVAIVDTKEDERPAPNHTLTSNHSTPLVPPLLMTKLVTIMADPAAYCVTDVSHMLIAIMNRLHSANNLLAIFRCCSGRARERHIRESV